MIEPRIKLMIEKLKDLSARGFLHNDYKEEFIWSLDEQLKAGKTLSEKQISKLEEIFGEEP